MTQDGPAQQARQDIADKVKGRAKEVFGAITGKDELTEEGRAQQAEVTLRREAEAEETAAAVQAEEANQNLAEAEKDAEDAKQSVEDITDANEAAAQNDRLEQKRAAEARAMQSAELGRVAAENASVRKMEEAVVDRHDEELSASEEIDAATKDYADAKAKADALERRAEEARKNAEEKIEGTE
jgi:uncharacterized protein YjbJ (UPF0337 family)